MPCRHAAAIGIAAALLTVCGLAPPAAAQRELSGAARSRLALERLGVLGSVLMIAAHPDDENTALLAYLARGRHLRTAYLSLTRGEGGQNLIGAEQSALLGLIRTQELLAARRIDGAEQFFTRAIDFGYSKTAEETLSKWGREAVLGDIVWVIRRFRPDVVILRFSGTGRDGHGHHQSSAILGREAFRAAGDPARFPEQLRWVRAWQAKRLCWNVFSFGRGGFRDTDEVPGRLDLDPGEYDPVLGFSYAEIAGMSRSLHRSQGFGAPERKGSAVNSLVTVDGDPASRDLMVGIEVSWGRVPGGESAGRLIAEAAAGFDPEQPEKTIPMLIEARRRIRALGGDWPKHKLAELDEAVATLAGLWLDAAADQHLVVPGSGMPVEITALNRSRFPLELLSFALDGQAAEDASRPLAYNEPFRRELRWAVPPDQPYTQPYWLREAPQPGLYSIADLSRVGDPDTPPERSVRFRIRAAGEELQFDRPVLYRWVDRVRGERTRAVSIVPPVSVAFAESAVVYPEESARDLEVRLAANAPGVTGDLRLRLPPGWKSEPGSIPFQLPGTGRQAVVRFRVTPPAGEAVGEAEAVAVVAGREIRTGTLTIDHEHIPPQVLAPPARIRLVRAATRTLARRVGYVMGAGDDVPQALRQLGCEVSLLSAEDLARGALAGYDAIVTGVRAYNVREDLRAARQRLLDYVAGGGTLVVQYNVGSFRPEPGEEDPLADIGPYPLTVGRDRVSVEEAEMRFLAPDHPILRAPNRITAADFDGWVQERGLYYASRWDARYQPLWESSDPGEKPLAGGTLAARHGRGVYIFTPLSWFRQLPAGVPGAYRIFANFLSAGRTWR